MNCNISLRKKISEIQRVQCSFFFLPNEYIGHTKKLSKECVPRCLISTGYTLRGGEIFIFPIIQRTIKNRVLKTSSHDRKDSSDNWNVSVHVVKKLRLVISKGNYWSSGVLKLFKPSVQLTYKYFKQPNISINLKEYF